METIVNATNNTSVQFRKVATVKAQSNEALFKLIEQAISRKPVQIIVTPRVDRGGYPYYWVIIRFDLQELHFKLQVNDQIMNFILAYLKGEESLPTVTEFEATEKIENAEDWLFEHEVIITRAGISVKEELSMKDNVNYLIRKGIFINGRINFPPIKFDNVSLFFV